MSKYTLEKLSIAGFIVINYFSIILPKDPFKMIPSLTPMTCDKPLWFCIDLVGNFFYFSILLSFYEKCNQKEK